MNAHTPVLLDEVIKYLDPHPGGSFIDATADGGGHTLAIIKAVQPTGRVLAVEWDEDLFEELKVRLEHDAAASRKNYALARASYTRLANAAASLGFSQVQGVLMDFGMSSWHLEASRRGFSFQKDEELDMRYSREIAESAADIVNSWSPEELEKIFRDFGEERFARVIAREIVAARSIKPVTRTSELVEIIRRATPRWYQRGRIHFATKTFQALRIAVNRELENIALGLDEASKVLAPGGRIVTITFHSLEDRVVKSYFRQEDIKKVFRPLTKKPLSPSREEIKSNPRARSAKLRAFEKI